MAPESSLNGSTSEQRVSDLLHPLNSLRFWPKPGFQMSRNLISGNERMCIAGQKRAPQFWAVAHQKFVIVLKAVLPNRMHVTSAEAAQPYRGTPNARHLDRSRAALSRGGVERPLYFLFALCNLPQALAVLTGSLERLRFYLVHGRIFNMRTAEDAKSGDIPQSEV